MAFCVVIEKLVDIPHVSNAHRHEAEIGTCIGIQVGVHGDWWVFRKEHCLCLNPAIVFSLQLPVLSCPHDIVFVIGIERLVPPVVDFKGKTWEGRIADGWVVYVKAVLNQLMNPASGAARKRVARCRLGMKSETWYGNQDSR